MANEEHVARLRDGVAGWNAWRHAHVDVVPDLSEADLAEANLIEANLEGANLRGTNLREVILTRAELAGADLAEANLTEANPREVDLIEYLPSLVGAEEVIKYYSCFISYSHQDEAFAQRLHSRLRDHHLRVWYAPEDMQGGKKLYDQIDAAIIRHDKLLLVLSEQSMQSAWVTTEIRRARKAELKTGKRKLFPIRLVDFATLRDWELFDADSGTDLAVAVREYFIPDFCDWKDHDAFEAAFARLLRDLQAAEQAS